MKPIFLVVLFGILALAIAQGNSGQDPNAAGKEPENAHGGNKKENSQNGQDQNQGNGEKPEDEDESEGGGKKHGKGHRFFKKLMKKLAKNHPEVAKLVEEAKKKFKELKASGGEIEGDKKKWMLKLATDAGLDVSMFEGAKLKELSREERQQLKQQFFDANKAKFPELEEWKNKRMHDEGDEDGDEDDEDEGGSHGKKWGKKHGKGHRFFKKLMKKLAKNHPEVAKLVEEAKKKFKELKASGGEIDGDKKKMMLKLATDAGLDVSMFEGAELKELSREERHKLKEQFFEANKEKFPELEEWKNKRMHDEGDEDEGHDEDGDEDDEDEDEDEDEGGPRGRGWGRGGRKGKGKKGKGGKGKGKGKKNPK